MLLAGCQTLTLSDLDEEPSADVVATVAAQTVATNTESLPESVAVGSKPATPVQDVVSAGVSEIDSHDVDPHILEQFQEWLDHDEWQVDVKWSVLSSTKQCPTRAFRWTFIVPRPAGRESSTVAESDHWQPVWEGDFQRLSTADQAAATASLRRLQSESGRIGRNALILLARLAPQASADFETRLQQICEGERPSSPSATSSTAAMAAAAAVPLGTRCAAAESWCHVLAEGKSTELEAALLPPGRLLQRPGIADELRGTLWRSMARWIDPDRLPELSKTLSIGSIGAVPPARQQAALDACLIAAAQHRATQNPYLYQPAMWPPELLAYRLDDSPVVRRSVARWAAWAQPPEALSILEPQLRDIDPAVQDAAIENLGCLGTPEAEAVLVRLAHDPQWTRKALVVAALGRFGPGHLQEFSNSPQADIRLAVARNLDSPDAKSREILRKLLSDTSPDVQAAVVETSTRFDDPQAIPLLLLAVEQSGIQVRKAAQLALSRRLASAPILPVEGTPIQRRDAVRAWADSQGVVLESWTQPQDQPSVSAPAMDSGSVLESLLNRYFQQDGDTEAQSQALWELRAKLRPEEIATLERAIQQHPGAPAALLQQQLLPAVSPAYAAIRGLQSSELNERRRGARELQTLSATQPLSIPVLQLLANLLAREQDPLIWHACLQAIQADGHDAAAQIALLAIHHVWPDLRRQGAEYFQRHPSPEAVPALLPLLQDANVDVQLATIRALAASGNPIAIQGLTATAQQPAVLGLTFLKSDRRESIRDAATIALAQLRDTTTLDELQRQLTSPSATERLKAVEVMGVADQTRFVEPLIALSWTESDGLVKRAILQSLNELVAETDRPLTDPVLANPAAIDAAIQSWVKWGQSRRSAASR